MDQVGSGQVFEISRVGSVRFGSVRFGSVRFGSVRFGSVRFGSVRIGSGRVRRCWKYHGLGRVGRFSTLTG